MENCDKSYSLFSHALWDNGSFIIANIHKLVSFLKARTGLTGTEAAVQILTQVILL